MLTPSSHSPFAPGAHIFPLSPPQRETVLIPELVELSLESDGTGHQQVFIIHAAVGAGDFNLTAFH